MGKNKDFLHKKSGIKTLILAVMVLDQLTSEAAGTQILKSVATFEMFPWNLGP